MAEASDANIQGKYSGVPDPSSEGEHSIEHTYSFWYNRRPTGQEARTQENYEKNIRKIGTFCTVEQFWSYYNHMVRPNDLPNTADYHMFKEGIKPMWEDDANKKGGKWIIRLKKGLATKYWEDLVLAVIGGQFEVGDQICGIVISIRYQEDIISVWNRRATDKHARDVIHETMKAVMNVPPNTVMEYKNHDASLKDNSSFRNTHVRME